MQIQTSFERGHITRRQLLNTDPSARPVLDRVSYADSVAEMTVQFTRQRDEAASEQKLLTGWAAATGVAAVTAVALQHPWIGAALGLGSGLLGYNALQDLRAKNQAQSGLRRLDELAVKTEATLVQPGANGTVVDKRFLDWGKFHNPQEVRKADTGEVLARSVEVELTRYNESAEKLTAEADVKAGTVTVRGPLGEGTFPGTLELPVWGQAQAKITRTDQELAGYQQTELILGECNALGMTNAQGNLIGTSSYTTGQDSIGLKDGVTLCSDTLGHQVAIQAPMASSYLGSSWDTNTVSTRVSDCLTVHQTVDLAPLQPLQAADVAGHLPVTGGTFKPRYGQEINLRYDAAAGTIQCSRQGSEWQVSGKLTDEGKIIMQQGEARVAQLFEGLAVTLKVRQGGEDASLEHVPGRAPVARVFEEKVPVEVQPDGSYRIQMPAGPVQISAAVNLRQLAG